MIQGTIRRALLGGSLAASVSVAAVLLVMNGSAQGDTTPPAPPATPVSVATVEQRDLINWGEYSGRLEAVERVELRSRVSGVVEAVHFQQGSLVKQGDLLFSIDQAPYQAEFERTQAQVVAAEARVALAATEHERGQRLMSTQNVSQRDLDTRLNALREAQANQKAAEAAVRTARLNLDYTQIRAPISGRIGRLEVTIGNLIAAGAGSSLLTTLVSVDPIYASFNADEKTVLLALATLPPANGGPRRLDLIPVQMSTVTNEGTPITGKLQFVDNAVDAGSGTVRVRAIFDNPDGALMPGQFVRIRLGQARSEPALVINERAVGTDQNKKFVFVVGPDSKASWREVTLGAGAEGLRIVTSGLKAGEQIVVNGLQRVRPGATVAPEQVPMAEKTELRQQVAKNQPNESTDVAQR
ncbi:efflux RND transporter periplasmic adaptor subunit [Bosea caraganae]|uniref:Efflux RND transporter periplasmic adaptor subunit n=1 Tax=Bosea caraganae TaxID=2763117 RepID=A0A370L7A0_9HYPH|nr:efflux RND transporter periplasmic adaptor subunit [Bosea caraganae]RDJ24948.1 efflux RND transporter periplasmic adaptor subunit [Bosea caraganae]RDJ26059.1 efflux RND transporter periplasmic adaptor subunit [Bosea caraganae]